MVFNQVNAIILHMHFLDIILTECCLLELPACSRSSEKDPSPQVYESCSTWSRVMALVMVNDDETPIMESSLLPREYYRKKHMQTSRTDRISHCKSLWKLGSHWSWVLWCGIGTLWLFTYPDLPELSKSHSCGHKEFHLSPLPRERRSVSWASATGDLGDRLSGMCWQEKWQSPHSPHLRHLPLTSPQSLLLRELRQKEQKFNAWLHYRVSWWTAWAT